MTRNPLFQVMLVLQNHPEPGLDEVKVGSERTFYFVAPGKGGLEVQHDGHEVVVITPQAPLAQELMGRRRGDRFKWGSGRAAVEYQIVGVS